MYKRLSLIAIAIAAICVGAVTRSHAAEEKEKKTKEVKVGDITLKTPASWKQTKPKSRLRLAQFEIPAAKDDEESAELAIFNFGGGGGVKANVERWIGQFFPDGRKAKTTVGKSELGKYVFVDITGTYKEPVGPPILRKTKPMEDARMLAVILAVEGKGNYFLKMTGKDKTVAAQADALRTSFGGDAEAEEELELE